MKTQLRFLIPMLLLLVFSCKEKNDGVRFTETKAVDSTYIAAPETPQQRRILVEEFTGAGCTQCPSGARFLENIADDIGERMIIIGIHTVNFQSLGNPVHGLSKFDFRTQKGSDLMNMFYPGLNAIPTIGVDRILYNGKTGISSRTLWAGAIDSRKNEPSAANMTLDANYNKQTRELNLEVSIAYTADVNKQQFLSVMLTEDNIIDAQKDGNDIDTFYNFKHILRDYFTAVGGDPFLQDIATKEAGRVYKRRLTFKVDDTWNPANSNIVAFVHNNEGDNKEILQAATAKVQQ